MPVHKAFKFQAHCYPRQTNVTNSNSGMSIRLHNSGMSIRLHNSGMSIGLHNSGMSIGLHTSGTQQQWYEYQTATATVV